MIYVLEYLVWKGEHDNYISLCKNLEVASCGKTAEEALVNLQDAVALYIKTATEDEILYDLDQVTYPPTHMPNDPLTKNISLIPQKMFVEMNMAHD